MSQPAKAQQEQWATTLQNDRATLMAMPAFCRVMQHWISAAGVLRSTYHGENTHASAFSEGQRNLGLRMLSDLEAATPTAMATLAQHARPATRTTEPHDHD